MTGRRRKRDTYPEPKSPVLADRNRMMTKARMMGATLATLARAYRLSRTHVHRIVSGVPVLFSKPRQPAKSRARPERGERFRLLKMQARDLRKLGFSYGEIAERLGICRSTAFNAGRKVLIADLQGRAWLSHAKGRPREWVKTLRTPKPKPARLWDYGDLFGRT